MTLDFDFLFRTIVSMLVITSPFEPVKILVFNQVIERTGRGRTVAAAQVALSVALVLVTAALAGRELLELLGIELDAFRVVGGLIVAAMGAEMLHGGGGSQTQGESERQRGPDGADALTIPLTIPLIAGPGAITTTIAAVSAAAPEVAVPATLIGCGVVALVVFLSLGWFGGLLARANPSAMAVVARLGGMLLATIGVQMTLEGLKGFFA